MKTYFFAAALTATLLLMNPARATADTSTTQSVTEIQHLMDDYHSAVVNHDGTTLAYAELLKAKLGAVLDAEW